MELITKGKHFYQSSHFLPCYLIDGVVGFLLLCYFVEIYKVIFKTVTALVRKQTILAGNQTLNLLGCCGGQEVSVSILYPLDHGEQKRRWAKHGGSVHASHPAGPGSLPTSKRFQENLMLLRFNDISAILRQSTKPKS